MAWGSGPKGRSQMPNLLRFWGYFFVHSHFLHLHTLGLSPLSSLTSPLSLFTLSLPYPKQVNKKPS